MRQVPNTRKVRYRCGTPRQKLVFRCGVPHPLV